MAEVCLTTQQLRHPEGSSDSRKVPCSSECQCLGGWPTCSLLCVSELLAGNFMGYVWQLSPIYRTGDADTANRTALLQFQVRKCLHVSHQYYTHYYQYDPSAFYFTRSPVTKPPRENSGLITVRSLDIHAGAPSWFSQVLVELKECWEWLCKKFKSPNTWKVNRELKAGITFAAQKHIYVCCKEKTAVVLNCRESPL